MDRKQLFLEVDELIAKYCNGCFLYAQLKKESGRRKAHSFCITKCTVGEKIKLVGKYLS